MSMTRQIKRNKVKKYMSNNKIRRTWRAAQIKKYGFKQWLKTYLQSGGREKLDGQTGR